MQRRKSSSTTETEAPATATRDPEGPARDRILERIAIGSSVRELLLEVADVVEGAVPEAAAAVHIVDADARRLVDGVSPSLEAEAVEHLGALSEALWPPGRFGLGRSPVLLRSSDRDLPDELRDLLRGGGFTGARVLPALSSKGRVVATLTVLCREDLETLDDDDPVLLTATSLLALGLGRLRALARLRLAQYAIDESRQPAVCLREDGSFFYVNDAACKATGYSRAELLQMRIFELDPEATISRYRRIWRLMTRRRGLELETDIERKDGSRLPVKISVSLVGLEDESYACALVQDQTELRRTEARLAECQDRVALAEQRLNQDGLHDDLTGLPSRSTFMDHVRRSLERAKRSRTEYRFAVLFLDFDRFKRINDSLGHMAGDRLLVAVAARLNVCVRPGDAVARIGGDEFAILLERVGAVTEATRVSERIHQSLREPFNIQGVEVFVTTSIGIAMGSSAYERPEDVLHDADTAMYRAKAAGRARHEVFDEAMHARAMEQLRLEAELRRALSREEFRLLYQPIVALDGRKPVGFEAFARWKHPTRGLLFPVAFLQAAEDSGLIVEIGSWVFTEACRQMQIWREQFDAPALQVHVNVSDRQLFQPDLSGHIERLLADTGLAPDGLVLDIPENVIMQRADTSVMLLSQLKSLGIFVHLDDFGTGYSSLGYLHRFQIDALKIDRSFVRHLRAGGDNWIAVRTIVSLAENLGMDVIAEGVETEEQLEHLLELGCAFAQGSLFHDPLPADEAAAILES